MFSLPGGMSLREISVLCYLWNSVQKSVLFAASAKNDSSLPDESSFRFLGVPWQTLEL